MEKQTDKQTDKIELLKVIIDNKDALINARNEELRDAENEAEYLRGIIEGYRRALEILIGTGDSDNE